MDLDFVKNGLEKYYPDGKHEDFLLKYGEAFNQNKTPSHLNKIFLEHIQFLEQNSQKPIIGLFMIEMMTPEDYIDVTSPSNWQDIKFCTRLTKKFYNTDMKRKLMELMAFGELDKDLSEKQTFNTFQYLTLDTDKAWKTWTTNFEVEYKKAKLQPDDCPMQLLTQFKMALPFEIHGTKNNNYLTIIKTIVMLIDQICSECHIAVFLTMIPIFEKGLEKEDEEQDPAKKTIQLPQSYGAKNINDFIGDNAQKWCQFLSGIPEDVKVTVVLPAAVKYSDLVEMVEDDDTKSHLFRLNSAVEDFARIVRCHMPSTLSDRRHSLPGVVTCAKVDRCCLGIGRGGGTGRRVAKTRPPYATPKGVQSNNTSQRTSSNSSAIAITQKNNNTKSTAWTIFYTGMNGNGQFMTINLKSGENPTSIYYFILKNENGKYDNGLQGTNNDQFDEILRNLKLDSNSITVNSKFDHEVFNFKLQNSDGLKKIFESNELHLEFKDRDTPSIRCTDVLNVVILEIVAHDGIHNGDRIHQGVQAQEDQVEEI